MHAPLLTAAGIPHAFTMRLGGISGPPFDSLNFGNPMDLPPSQPRDPVSNIDENFRRVLAAINASAREIVQVYQIHSNVANVFRPGEPSRDRRPLAEGYEDLDFKADALITDDPSRMLAVRVADCCPILLGSEDGTIVAAVHAGWRGVVSNILRSAVEAMQQVLLSPPSRGTGILPVTTPSTSFLAAIGPCIGPTRFEVGPEVLEQFESAFGNREHIIPHHDPAARRAGKGFVHIQSALRAQLLSLGITRIDTIEACTASDPTRFFSHRRDNGITGRMVGVIGPK